MFDTSTTLASYDPEVAKAIELESQRQEEHIELIASENYTSPRVMAAQGSKLTNKYAEGYPGKRYYGGCEFVDDVEMLAIERAKQLFGADYANVQPHSGSQANAAVYHALVEPGDTILGMSLDAGGHLTHGAKPNQSGKWFNAVQYGVRREDAALEQSLRTLRSAGWLAPGFRIAITADHGEMLMEHGMWRHSFVFEGRSGAYDYAIATPGLAGQVTGAIEWHINADEPPIYDYNLEFGRDAALFDGNTVYRASDHDPVIVGLDISD